ncbi:hypothetical protein FRC10_008635 [Ceratobasidium sp. 414]|nr:hypothetical protein FRC10_008635 [Ceratobasidium sp. 414]
MPCSLEIGKPTLPSISTGRPRKRAQNDVHLDQAFTIHNQPNGAHYYTYGGRYLTADNIYNPRARAAFLRAAASIGQCTANHALELSDCEIVITLKCISEQDPKFSYYIMDHKAKVTRWAHGRQFRDSPDLYDVNMRNVAEYWDHRSRFSAHRLCSQSDYDELLHLLGTLPTGQDAVFTVSDISHFRERLQRVQDPTTMDGTHTISDLHASVLKEQLRGFYEPNLSLRCKLMKSLSGLVSLALLRPVEFGINLATKVRPPRFLHRRTHRAATPTPGALATGPMNPNRGGRSPHPVIHNNSPGSPRRTSPQSSTDSESSRRANQTAA